MARRSTGLILFAVIALLSAAIYFRLVVDDPFLAFDDKVAAGPIAEVHSLRGYRELRAQGKILDVLPVRDLSYYIDYRIKKSTGLSPFHATNLVIWLALLFFAFRILTLLYGRGPAAWAAFALFSLHPITVGSIGWISARKHILAGFFVMAATWVLLKAVRENARGTKVAAIVALLYALSVLSQPITLLWPLWAALFVALNESSARRRLLVIPLACVPIMVACAVMNYHYYTGPYVALSGITKFATSPDADLGMRLLALGRYFANFVLPARLAATYYPGSPWNIAGLALFAVSLFLIFKALPRKPALVWLAYFLFPLSVVLARMTNIFVSDTYALTALFGLVNLLALACGRIRRGYVILAAVAVAFVPLSIYNARAWSSDYALWRHAYRTEPTPFGLRMYAHQLLARGEYDEALRLAVWLKDWEPHDPLAVRQWAAVLFEDPRLSVEKKIETIEREGSSAWRDYYLSLLYAQRSDFRKSFNLVAPHFFSGRSYELDLMHVAGQAYSYCVRAGVTNCAPFADSLRKHYGLKWHEDEFRKD